MVGNDFRVETASLASLASELEFLVGDQWRFDVEDFLPARCEVTDEEVWDAVSVFRDRWELGMNALSEDLAQVSERVSAVAGRYIEFDQTATDAGRRALEAVHAAAFLCPAPGGRAMDTDAGSVGFGPGNASPTGE